nr:truncated ORF10 protein [Severe acute respiratory syndrome coronavirus 2]QXJ00377.1 truncated ORF10 protein [Severe acute respiratory syndrome coronavirus 2]
MGYINVFRFSVYDI